MPKSETPEFQPTSENNESFQDILSEYEQSHSRKNTDGSRQIVGTVISVTSESVFLDIGFKTEGILPLTAFSRVKPRSQAISCP